MPRHGALARFKAFAVFQHSVLLLSLTLLRSYSLQSSKFLRPLSAVSASNFERIDEPVHQSLVSGCNSTVSTLSAKVLQVRQPHTNRRPPRYWSNITNFRRELELFWLDRGLQHDFVLIPSETLLYYYNRHDLRGAIASLGGREALATMIPNTRVFPGRWADAMEQYPELLAADPDLSERQTPRKTQAEETTMRWKHSSTRREKGYWNITSLFKELYNYTYSYRRVHSRPCTWMPRLSELAKHGRSDLKQAIQRYGGYDSICRRAGMIPYKEWAYFEGQLCLFLELREYCRLYQNDDCKTFPCVSDIDRAGYKRLHSLIQYYGGRNFLALKLGMVPERQDFGGATDMISFGAFDLELGVQLLLFIRDDHLCRTPPLKHCVIAMPSAKKLRERCEKGEWIHEKICEYGGYENVARRLGLAI